MTLFIKLLLAHFIGDFVLQRDDWVKDKEEKKGKSIKLYWHVLVHIGLSFVIVWDLTLWWIILLIGVSHLLIDLWKLYFQNDKNRRWVFLVDQGMHIVAIALLVNVSSPFLKTLFSSENMDQMFLMTLALIMVTVVGSHGIKILISRWQPENDDKEEESLSEAGSYIGMLERAFVFGFMISGNLQAIGFLLAAKSIFRFGDLKESKDRKLTEYVLIGTLLSFGVAILISLGFIWANQIIA